MMLIRCSYRNANLSKLKPPWSKVNPSPTATHAHNKITTLDSVHGIPATSIFVFEASVLGSGAMGGRDKLLSVSAGAQCMRDDGSKVAESAKRPTSGTWRGELIVPVVVCEVM